MLSPGTRDQLFTDYMRDHLNYNMTYCEIKKIQIDSQVTEKSLVIYKKYKC